MRNSLYSSSSSSSSSDDDSGRNPLFKSFSQGKNFQELIKRWNDVERTMDEFVKVSRNAKAGAGEVSKVGSRVAILTEKYQTAINNMHNASCKTALDLLPLSKRSNGAQNEKSNEEVYKEKLEDFKLQLTELNEFFNKQQLTKDGRRRFIEDIARITVNISELDDLIPYLIKEKSKTKTQDVSTVAKPQLTPSDLLPHSILTSSRARVKDVEQLLSQRSPVAPFSRQ